MNKNSTVNIDKAGGFKPGSGTMLKAVGRKPIRVVLALVLELLFRKGLSKVLGRDAKGN